MTNDIEDAYGKFAAPKSPSEIIEDLENQHEYAHETKRKAIAIEHYLDLLVPHLLKRLSKLEGKEIL